VGSVRRFIDTLILSAFSVLFQAAVVLLRNFRRV
jgi:hypothetical protein